MGHTPTQSYNLVFQTKIPEAGNPTANATVIEQGDSTTIFANLNNGYLFKEWKILSGIGSSIEDLNAESTRFTMGSSDTTIEAVYEKKKWGNLYVLNMLMLILTKLLPQLY